jgi:hypothetical protein
MKRQFENISENIPENNYIQNNQNNQNNQDNKRYKIILDNKRKNNFNDNNINKKIKKEDNNSNIYDFDITEYKINNNYYSYIK